MIEPGSQVCLRYPLRNHVAADPEFVRRAIQIRRVRDLMTDPLDVAEYLRRPYIRRSRWLVSGIDQDCGKWRQFYVGSSAEHRSPGVLKACLWDLETNKPYQHLARPFQPTPSECTLLARLLVDWRKQELTYLRLVVYSDDLRLIG